MDNTRRHARWWQSLGRLLAQRRSQSNGPEILSPDDFHRALHREWSRSQRIGLPVSMVVFSRPAEPEAGDEHDGASGNNGHHNGNGNGNGNGKAAGNNGNGHGLEQVRNLGLDGGNGNGHRPGGTREAGAGEKSILDRYARALDGRIRGTDLLGWLVEGKLGLLLPHTSGQAAWRLAEEIRERVEGDCPESQGWMEAHAEIKVYAYPPE